MNSQKHTLFFSLALFIGWSAWLGAQVNQLVVDPNFTPTALINDVFASGSCETITNIQGIGRAEGRGVFSGAANIVGFDRGIILSTGRAISAPGPNTTNDTGNELEGLTGDVDLVEIADEDVFDHVGLEFDFVPLDSNVTFRYVFASEEYCEFVGSDYNDVFGFFVSGPGLNGSFSSNAINAALVPGTTAAVSINTINHTTNESFYRPNELTADQVLCNLPIVANPLRPFLAYDGLTTVLTATLKLIPCETYHIRLVVADVGDSDYDSAVMLEAGSFDLGGSVSLNANGADTVNQFIFEGCDSGGFRVSRGSDSNPNQAQTINYRFGENSQAQVGVDFINPGGSVTIPAGQDFVDVTIQTIPDGPGEGPESIWILLDIPCACYTDSIMITLVEPQPLSLELAEAYYCPDQTATLRPIVTGGSPPYSFQWSTGNTEENPVLFPPLPAMIDVQVTDACGQTVSQQIGTFSSTPPSAAFIPQTITACWGEERELEVALTGRPPFELVVQRSGNAPDTLLFDEAGLQRWRVNVGGNYVLLSVTDQACNGPVTGNVMANFYRPVINPSLTNPTCADATDGSISIEHLPSVAPYEYTWTGTNAEGLLAENLTVGSYSLSITDALGCSDFRAFNLRGPTALQPIEVSCNQIRRPPLMLSADGGQPPYLYSTDGANFWPGEEFDQLIEGQYYDLFIRDQNGCEIIQTDFFYPRASPRNLNLDNFIAQELGGSVQVQPDFLVPVDQVTSIRWYPAEYFDCPSCRQPFLSAPFSQPVSVSVTDRYGCTDSLATWVGVDGRVPLFVPTVFSPNGDGTNDFVPIFANTLQVAEIVSFRLFSRWGSQVYQLSNFPPNSARRGWDGLINGAEAPEGAYAWVAELLLTNGERLQKTGSVVLIR